MKKERLKTQLFEAAWQIVESEGVDRLNIRKLATKCSCAVGSVYTIFKNFQELHLTLNMRILSMLYARLGQTLESGMTEEKSLREVFQGLGKAYIEFGQENLLLWKCLFEYLPKDRVPDWYLKHAREGIYQLCERISLNFGIPTRESKKIVGFFWTSVHGVSAIFLNQKMQMVSELFEATEIDDYVEYCLDGLFKEVLEEQLVSS